ncbi:hypothetical protein [Tenacibaculum caenipelagi]|uniref:Uncharacterized protein n=1 Tax=Tenacibaculum caenipelagi TaxID=1325435 RepID=A0A4V3D2V6_9FLAO|nr:hypothetical protein [Tenacibaculum caenipelagi]TDQ23895.1 hypothetical protein DFQ07_2427 [Tenacibaculum caenipelagi]
MKNLLPTCFTSISKAIKIAVMLLPFLIVTSINAQENKQRMETTNVYIVNVETMDGKTIPYKIRVNETRRSRIKFASKDKMKLNQARAYSPQYVTKLIYVDKDVDNIYDTYIVLRYKKDPNDSFKLKPTKRGFNVEVNKKYVEYIFGEGIYFVNNKDADYFFVTEFEEY